MDSFADYQYKPPKLMAEEKFRVINEKIRRKYSPFILLFLLTGIRAGSQTLTLQEAVNSALNNYGTVKAKGSYLKASEASVKQASSVYLPNLNLAAQQAYGTANGKFGPVIGIGGLTAASSGPPFLTQNWNAAFGGLIPGEHQLGFLQFWKGTRERESG